MIPRYTNPEMGAIWSDQRRYETWLEVELAAADAMAEAGIVPARRRARAARARRRSTSPASRRSSRSRSTTSSPSRPRSPSTSGPAARWLHFGLTSSDVVDTAQALQMREACDLIVKDIDALMEAVRDARRGAPAHADDRPHARRARRADDLRPEAGALVRRAAARPRSRAARARRRRRSARSRARSARSRISTPSIEARRLPSGSGCEPAPVSSQVIQRDRHAELLSALAITGASLEKFALEIRGLQKTEIGEVEEPFGKGQKGSSAMPHKRNPIGCEQIVGLARLLRGNAMAALENIALWHERDISHSSVERVILPDSFIALDHMLRRFTRIVARHGRLSRSGCSRTSSARAAWCSPGTVLLELARRGISREQAYEWVQRNAMRVVPRAARLQGAAAGRRRRHRGAAAGGDRAGVRSRRSAAERRRDLRAGVQRS